MDFVSSLQMKVLSLPVDSDDPMFLPTEYFLSESAHRYDTCQVCLQKHSQFIPNDYAEEKLVSACSVCNLPVHPDCMPHLRKVKPGPCMACQVATKEGQGPISNLKVEANLNLVSLFTSETLHCKVCF